MIESPRNEKLKLVRKLANRKYRDAEQLFVTEGEDLVMAGLAAGESPVFTLRSSESDLPSIESALVGLGAMESEAVLPELLDDVSGLGSGSRVIAVWRQRWETGKGAVSVYLDGVSDPGNVGSIIRSAHALIEPSVVVGSGTADPYGPKAVRAAMGSIFAVRPSRAPMEELPSPRIALTVHGGKWPPAEVPERLTVCLGSEREGLGEEVLGMCDEQWSIPMRPEGAESLNVAAAAAICFERVSSGFVRESGSDTAEVSQ